MTHFESEGLSEPIFRLGVIFGSYWVSGSFQAHFWFACHFRLIFGPGVHLRSMFGSESHWVILGFGSNFWPILGLGLLLIHFWFKGNLSPILSLRFTLGPLMFGESI